MDEAQDLSRAQLELVKKLPAEMGRMVFIGDPHQAICDGESWQRIQEVVKPTVFSLNLTYRCPKSHVDLASKVVPQIEVREDAPEGEVIMLHPGEVKLKVQIGDLVICRYIAPLVNLCLKLAFEQSKSARIRGKEIGQTLSNLAIKVADKFPRDFLTELESYVTAQSEWYKHSGQEVAIEVLQDQAKALEVCFETFGQESETIEAFCQQVLQLFDDDVIPSKQVILSPIHSCRGLEAERVFLIKSESMPALSLATTEWQRQQEWNLLYVALTRSRRELYLVPMPQQSEQLDHYLDHPTGGIRLPSRSFRSISAPVDPQTDPDFAVEVDRVHEVLQRILRDFIEMVQVYQSDLPVHMTRVWPRLVAEFRSGCLVSVRSSMTVEVLPPKLQAPRSRAAPLLKVGDVCRYYGPSGAMNVTCWGRRLKVLNVSDEVATVTALTDAYYKYCWIQPYDIDLRHLRKVS